MSHPLRRPAVIVLAMAAGLGVVSGVGLVQQSQADTGDGQTFTTSDPAQSPAMPQQRGLTKGAASARPAAERPAPPPLRVSVPRLGVDERVLATGVEPSGQAEVPPDGDDIGWYEYGAAPGDPKGAAVLIGHRDTVAEGPGALFELDELRPDDHIVVTNRLGTVVYGVTSKTTFTKSALPSSLFTRTGPHVLHLITCGGDYLPDSGGYQDNLVVTAEVVRSDRGNDR